MQRYGGAAILMPANLHDQMKYLVGSEAFLSDSMNSKALAPFHPLVKNFLSDLSAYIMKDKSAAAYPDVITLGFFCRKAKIQSFESIYSDSLQKMIGRGVTFHIAPSNVPINFAYSLVAGLLSGNVCIVRVSEKEFPQVDIVCSIINKVLETGKYDLLKRYILVVKYGHREDINEYLSFLCDIRIIWGGDNTIAEIRKAKLPARSLEITFADRYSICAVNAEEYLKIEEKSKLALAFYNDTYLFDQNACSSPRLIYWIGEEKDIADAKELFWKEVQHILENKKYDLAAITAMDKLFMLSKAAIELNTSEISKSEDNRIKRVRLSDLSKNLSDYTCAGGVFYEYSAQNLDDLWPVVTRKFQTLTYVGLDPKLIREQMIENGIAGIDRIVPMGESTSFSLIWDGYDLIRQMTRMVDVI